MNLFLLAGILPLWGGPAGVRPTPPSALPVYTGDRTMGVAADARLCPIFEPNVGQTDPEVRFVSRGPGYTLFLSGRESVLVLGNHSVLRMRLAGARGQAAWDALEPLPGISNYFLGNDPARWRTNIPHYGRVRARDVYPGIDLLYYGNNGTLEYDFAIAPGADPSRIRLSFAGADSIRVAQNGDLILTIAGAELRQKRPIVSQTIDGRRVELAG